MGKTTKKPELECPICGGSKDKSHSKCWHCGTCGFASCAYRPKDIPEIVRSFRERLKEFYKQL